MSIDKELQKYMELKKENQLLYEKQQELIRQSYIDRFNTEYHPKFIEFFIENGVTEELQDELRMKCTKYDSLGITKFSFCYLGATFWFRIRCNEEGFVKYKNGLLFGEIVFGRIDRCFISTEKTSSFREAFFSTIAEIKRRRSLGWYANHITPYESTAWGLFSALMIVGCMVGLSYKSDKAIYFAIAPFVTSALVLRPKKIYQVPDIFSGSDDWF
jgi:hypothetical protein